MIIIPAIDLRYKKVVRLTQGDFAREKSYSDNPVDVAKKWQDEGAEFIHVVDLDGALAGEPKNLDVVEKIISAIKVPVQLGGGLRTRNDVAGVLAKGVTRAIIGTKACTDAGFTKALVDEFKEKIAVSIDAAGMGVVAAGWGIEVPKVANQLAEEMKNMGVKTIIFTNTIQDGMLKGIDAKWVEDMLDAAAGTNVIIAGGVSAIEDIKKLKEMKRPNLYGAIAGKALYEGTMDLKEAIKVAGEKT